MSTGHKVNLKNDSVFLAIVFLMIIILVDTMLIKFYDLIDKHIIPIAIKKVVFSIIASAGLLLQIFVVSHIRKLSKGDKSSTKVKIKPFDNLLKLAISSLIIIFSFMIFELFYFNYYHTHLLILIILITFGVGLIFVGRTLHLFISWFRLKRGFVFSLYILSMAMIIFNLIMTATVVTIGLNERPIEIRLFSGGTMDISAGKYIHILTLFRISAILSFISVWLTTVSLMRTSRDQIIGKILYWVILIAPLSYFITSYFAQDILSDLLFPSLKSNPVLISLIFTSIFILSKPIGGVIFGVLFWRISKLVNFEKVLWSYMIISGYGFLLLFSANQASSLVLAPYPPFGVITTTVIILATYLILIGIYKSAILASANLELRKSIYQIAKESKLLDIIGRTEMEKGIKNTVTKIVKYTSSVSLETPNFELDEKELRRYLEKVIDHLNKRER